MTYQVQRLEFPENEEMQRVDIRSSISDLLLGSSKTTKHDLNVISKIVLCGGNVAAIDLYDARIKEWLVVVQTDTDSYSFMKKDNEFIVLNCLLHGYVLSSVKNILNTTYYEFLGTEEELLKELINFTRKTDGVC